jgi:deoxyribodipyrimidine photolyase-related protein
MHWGLAGARLAGTRAETSTEELKLAGQAPVYNCAMRAGVWIIGDQCDRQASSLASAPRDAPVVFVESSKFCRRRPYHWQKLVLIFSVMRHFAAELEDAGRLVHYFKLADDFASALKQFVVRENLDVVYVMEPNDHDRAAAMPAIARKIGCQIQVTPNTQFLASHDDFGQWASGEKSLVMESFYQSQRRRLNVMIEADGSPMGGKWNLDKLNREGVIPRDLRLPEPMRFPPDKITGGVIEEVHRHFEGEFFGGELTSEQMRERFIWPVTLEQAESALRRFLADRLKHFGPFEDAMTTRSWSLWHSHLSVPMNCGILHPRTIIDMTLEHALPLVVKKKLPINSLEGFVRQVIGWREFMRGIYWREMMRSDAIPYPQRNELEATRDLPDFYWSGETEMNCVRHCVRPVIDQGYSHHIPRLMVLANFAMLHGISPQAVNEWFIYAYADGYEWVTTPNVIGMALYADGGIVATKPYAAGGAYIDRMSDYCTGCRYDPKKSTGPDGCPFTRAYWPFLNRHRKRLEKNPRVALTIKGLDRFSKQEIRLRSDETDKWLETLKYYK